MDLPELPELPQLPELPELPGAGAKPGKAAAAQHARVTEAEPPPEVAQAVAGWLGGGAPSVDYGVPATRLDGLLKALVDTTAAAPEPRFDRVTVDEAADFGPDPDNPVAAALYALRVITRKRALAAERPGAAERLTVAREAARAAAAGLGLELVARRNEPALAGLASAIARVDQAQARSSESAATEAKNAGAELDERAALEAAARAAQERAEPAAHARDEAQREVDALTRDRERAIAMLKRCDIELRGARTANDQARVTALEGTRAAREAEAEQARQTWQAAQTELVSAERELAARLGEVKEAERAVSSLEQAQQARRNAAQGALDEVGRARDAACIELTRDALRKKLVTPEQAAAMLAALEAFDAALDATALLDAAAESHDAAALRKGLVTWGAAALFLLVALGWLVG